MKCIVSIILRNEFSLAVWSLAQPLGITINSVSWYLSRLVWGHIAQHSSESWTLTLERGASSDYERAATRTIRNGHSSWHDPVWIKTQICITADFVPGRYLGTISSKLYKIKWPTRVNVQKIRWIPNIRHSSSFALGSTFDTQAKQLLRLGNTALDIHNHMILFGFCISSGSAEQGLAIRGNMNQISAVIYPGKARYSQN